MNLFKIKIMPLSLFETAIRADTLWGHICWAIRFIKGEKELKIFLDQYKMNEFPIVLSDVFPDGYLPLPLDPEIIFSLGDTSSKNLKKYKYVPISFYKDLEKGYDNFLSELKNYINDEDTKTNYYENVDEWHCSVNRFTGIVEMGMLFSKECFYFKNSPVVYLKTTFDKIYIEEIFNFISQNGYGADASSGRGRFNFSVSEETLPESNDPNAFVSLSHGFTDISEFKSCFYDYDVKFGKIGNNISSKPFKKPNISFKPGSIFMLKDSNLKLAYGSVKQNVHKSIDFVSEYCLIFPFYMRWKT